MKKLIRFLKEEDGLESVEYALLAVLIALGIVGGVTLLKNWINDTFTQVANNPETQTPAQ
jgi:Flp pilus assembly pilin Flp